MSALGIDRMLGCFEKDATDWLNKVKIEFDSNNLQFDENFRHTFVQTSIDRLNATYSKFILKSQLNRSTAAAARNTHAQGSPVRSDDVDGSTADVEVNIHDHNYDDDDNNGIVGPSVGVGAGSLSFLLDVVDDKEPEGNVAVTQQTIEVKPNLPNDFRDRNSPINSRRRRIINDLLQDSQRGKQANPSKRNPPRRRNPTEKKFKCDQCTYSAAIKSRLTEHERVHTKEKPFQCDICKERFGYRQNLKMHSLRRHDVILLN